ncbi:MAG: hypothetical protein SGI91_04540 [Alphaproteobacteria bacterium]|nr:hypothetical protein [Alphaproteobacteria bacterium]
MSHPILDVAGAVAVVAAVGAGAMLVLPQAQPDPPSQTIVLDVERAPSVRVEPLAEKTDAERVDDLQRELSAIAVEQKRLVSELRRAVDTRRERAGRRR